MAVQLNMLGSLQKEITVEEKRREVERLRYGSIRFALYCDLTSAL